jgi:hypothetical protein
MSNREGTYIYGCHIDDAQELELPYDPVDHGIGRYQDGNKDWWEVTTIIKYHGIRRFFAKKEGSKNKPDLYKFKQLYI